ncbi:MAG: hypothetical protein Q8R23_06440 [Methylotenera sp.]|jgi:uncharacterized membrane protein|nr:hypothetical protein [Methylotenera sp.]
MKIWLKRFANILTIVATLFLIVGLGYVLVKHQPIGDFISEAALCYLAIAAFNYIIFGAATLWHKKPLL